MRNHALDALMVGAMIWLAPCAAYAAPAQAPLSAAPRDVALAAQAWDVLKRSLTEESQVSGRAPYTDFREGAGVEALKSLPPSTYVALMSELAESPSARVRRRAVATLRDHTDAASVRTLRKALRDKDLAVRMEAAAALGARGDRSVVNVYRTALHAASREARLEILASMRRVPYKWMVPQLRVMLRDADPFVRVAACEALCPLGDEKAYMELRRCMRSSNKYVRSSAYAVVKDSAGERVVPMLTRALHDKDRSIQIFAAVYLARNGSARGLHVLKVALQRSEPAFRYTVVDALAMLKDPRGLPLLRMALRDKSADVRVRAAHAWLGRGLDAGPALAVLKSALKDKATALRVKTVAAARAGANAGVPILQQALSDRSRLVRQAAVDALSSVPEVRDRSGLRAALRDGDAAVRVSAAILLVRLGERSAGEALKGFVQEGAAERTEAEKALVGTRAPQVVPYLQMLAQSGSTESRLKAITALGEQRVSSAAEALDEVIRKSDDDALRLPAVEALAQVGGDLSVYLLKGLLAENQALSVRWAAAAALGDRGVTSAVPLLKQAVGENNVRAARALCKMGDLAGVPVYRKVLQAADLGQRIEAAVVLYRLERLEPAAGVSGSG